MANNVNKKIGFMKRGSPISELEEAAKDAILSNSSYEKIFSRRQSSMDKEIPSMASDAVIGSALGLVVETALQINNDQGLFKTVSPYRAIKEELDRFHESVEMDKLLLTLGYNLLEYGNMPIRLHANEKLEITRVSLVPDYTAVTPIVVANQVIGFLDKEGNYLEPFEYVYAQLLYYKDMGGSRASKAYLSTKQPDPTEEEFVNEFSYAPSYLSLAYKPYKSIKIIEDALLMQRLDQSNFMRFIMVSVGENVLSKNAVQVYNFYRSIIKKARRLNFDSDGFMSSSGANNEFEMVLPKTPKQDVDIKDIGGQVEVKAVKDLDFQYKRLFASLRVSPSQIGFSEDSGGSLGDSPVTVWEKRFARTVKTLVVSLSHALRSIDYYYLRSRGYDVSKSNWAYQFVAVSTLEENEKRQSIKAGAEAYKVLAEVLDASGVPYNKKYLLTQLMSEVLASSNVDMTELFEVPEDQAAPPQEIMASKSSLLYHDRKECYSVFAAHGLMSQEELDSVHVPEEKQGKAPIFSSHRIVSYEDFQKAADVLANTSCVVKLNVRVKSCEGLKLRPYRGKTLPVLREMQLFANVDELSASELVGGTIAPIKKLVLLKDGFYLDKEDLVNYLFMVDSGVREVPVDEVQEEI